MGVIVSVCPDWQGTPAPLWACFLLSDSLSGNEAMEPGRGCPVLQEPMCLGLLEPSPGLGLQGQASFPRHLLSLSSTLWIGSSPPGLDRHLLGEKSKEGEAATISRLSSNAKPATTFSPLYPAPPVHGEEAPPTRPMACFRMYLPRKPFPRSHLNPVFSSSCFGFQGMSFHFLLGHKGLSSNSSELLKCASMGMKQVPRASRQTGGRCLARGMKGDGARHPRGGDEGVLPDSRGN